MPELGKADREFFDKYIYPNLGADRDDVTLGPQHGVDFGVIQVGEQAVALASDPVYIQATLGLEKAAWFGFHVLLSDVAVSGIPPSHLAVDVNLPPEITDEEFRTVWETFDREARDLGVSIVTGHTGRYQGCNYPMVGGATALSVGDPEDVVRPDGARAGDSVIVTKGPAIEATALLANEFEEYIDLDSEAMDAAKERFWDQSPVKDALTAAAAGPVTAMHDATECGIYGGLYEVARAGGVRIEVDRDRVPVLPGVRELCDAVGIDPWISISEGTLLLTVDSDGTEDVLAALDDEGIPAAEVGHVVAGSGVEIDGEEVDHPGTDPFWATFGEYAQRRAEDATR
ncbi:MAG: AIR synthase family protein [Halobacteriaceae archaeon]